MAVKKTQNVDNLELTVQSTPTDSEKAKLLADVLLKREPLAESALEMAKMFMAKGQTDVAHRRLRTILTDYEHSNAAEEARALLAHWHHPDQS